MKEILKDKSSFFVLDNSIQIFSKISYLILPGYFPDLQAWPYLSWCNGSSLNSISTEWYHVVYAAFVECWEIFNYVIQCCRFVAVWNFGCYGTWYSSLYIVERYPHYINIGWRGQKWKSDILYRSLDFIGHPTLNIGLGEAPPWAAPRARPLGQTI